MKKTIRVSRRRRRCRKEGRVRWLLYICARYCWLKTGKRYSFVCAKTIFVNGMTLSTEFNKSHIWQKKECVVRRRNNLVFRRCYSLFTVVVVCVRCVIFCLFPCFYVSSKESLFFFTAWEAELLNEQTLASNEMQACLQNGGKEGGIFPVLQPLKCFSSFVRSSLQVLEPLTIYTQCCCEKGCYLLRLLLLLSLQSLEEFGISPRHKVLQQLAKSFLSFPSAI